MLIRKISDEELEVIALEILSRKKLITDFLHLDEDQIAKIKTMLHRNFKGLARISNRVVVSNEKATSRAGGTKNTTKIDSSKSLDAKKEEVERKTRMLYALIQINFLRIFPIEELIKHPPHPFLNKWMEVMIAHFTPVELALFFKAYTRLYTDKIESILPVQLQENIKHFMDNLTEADLNLHFDALASKYSYETMVFILKEPYANKQLKDYTQTYFTNLYHSLLNYCSKIYHNFDLPKYIQQLTPSFWIKITGITPRKDIATLHFILPAPDFQMLIHALPQNQKDEVLFQSQLFKNRLETDLTAIIELIEATKRWIFYLDNLLEN